MAELKGEDFSAEFVEQRDKELPGNVMKLDPQLGIYRLYDMGTGKPVPFKQAPPQAVAKGGEPLPVKSGRSALLQKFASRGLKK